MTKKSFILHKDSLAILDEMTDEQAGQLFKAIYNYQVNGDECCDDFGIRMAFAPFKTQFVRDSAKYTNVVERNRANGSKGGRPKKTQSKPKKPNGLSKNPKKPDSDSDSDNVSDNEINGLFTNPLDIAINEFRLHRKQMRKPLSALAEQKLRKKLSKYDVPVAVDMVNQSIENGWQGVFDIRKTNNTQILNTDNMDYGTF